MIREALQSIIGQKKIRVIVEGPPLCGKTTLILNVLKESGKKFVHLTVNDLYSNPSVSPASIATNHIANDEIIFIDDVEAIFPENDVDYNFMYRFLSSKPKLIAACRSKADVNVFVLRYLNMYFRMEQPPSPKDQKLEGVPNVTFSDIGGAARAKDLVLMMASWCVVNAEKVKSWGLKAPSGEKAETVKYAEHKRLERNVKHKRIEQRRPIRIYHTANWKKRIDGILSGKLNPFLISIVASGKKRTKEKPKQDKEKEFVQNMLK